MDIKKDTVILLLISAANRDPAFVERPDCFDIARPESAQLSFGKGRHACIGGPLVRQQLKAALQALLEAFPQMALADTELDWQPRMAHRWLRSLRLQTD